MNYQDIIHQLHNLSSEKYKSHIIKMGIPALNCLGVPLQDIRQLAKTIGHSNQLGFQLWKSQYHDAKLLAVLIFEYKQMTFDDINLLIKDVISWDLCNHLCKNLIIKIKGYQLLIPQWVTSQHIYVKRAAFVLLACDVIHNKNILDSTLDTYLHFIRDYSHDEHIHIKKAISAALKEIGKKDFDYHEKALLLSYELIQDGDKVQRWIANDAKKELEKLVKVQGRSRLISRHSLMGKEEH